MRVPSFIYIGILALIFILNFQRFSYSALDNAKEASLLYTLKNREAPLEARKAAVVELSKYPNAISRKTFIDILQNKNESRILHQQIASAIIAEPDPEILAQLKKLLNDKKTSPYLREVALSILWKQNSESILPILLRFVRDPFETIGFRTTAIRYLYSSSNKTEVKEVMTDILKDTEESPEMKQLAIKVLEKCGDPSTVKNVFQDIALDRSRNIEERMVALEKLGRESPSLMEEKLFGILDDKNESQEIKRLAFQKIAVNQQRLLSVLPQLKRLERMGPLVGIDEQLRNDLRDLIEKLETKMKADSEQSGQHAAINTGVLGTTN